MTKIAHSEDIPLENLKLEDFDEDGVTDTDSLISSGPSPLENSAELASRDVSMIEMISKKRESDESDEEMGLMDESDQLLITGVESCCLSMNANQGPPPPLPPPPPLLPPLPPPSTKSRRSFLPAFPLDETWPPWSMEAFRKWPIFLSLALPAALSLFLEWGSYEVMAGFAGQLGSIQLATHGVYMNTASLAYNGPMAIADATSVLTGNYLGKNQPSDASSMVLLGVTVDSFLGLITGGILLLFLRSYWGYLFTSDIEVIRAVHQFMPILFLYMFVDSIKCVTCNVLRSTGRPGITTYGNLFCCLFILIPVGWYLALKRNWGLIGLWGGMSIGWGVAALLYSVILYQTDWSQQALEAYERNQASSKKSSITNTSFEH